MTLVIYNTQNYRITYNNTTHSPTFVPLPPFQKYVHTHQQLKLTTMGAKKDLQHMSAVWNTFFLTKILESLIALEYKDIILQLLKIILQLLES